MRQPSGSWAPAWYAGVVPTITLAALLDTHPSRPFWGRTWVADVLGRHLPGFHPSETARLTGWTVGAVVGGETLVQSRPIVRDGDVEIVDDLLRTEAACTVAAFASVGPDEIATPRDQVRTSRYRRWVAVQSDSRLSAEVRRGLHTDLPPFLARDAARRTDAELVLYRFLAGLVERGAFGNALAPPEAIRQSLAALQDHLPEEPANLFVTDGRSLGILHRGGTLLAFEPPEDVRPARRFRVEPGDNGHAPACLFVWLDGPGPDQPIAGCEKIAQGVLSASSADPTALTRD